MDKVQALQSFWSSFSLPAYDENTVPPDAVMPYITYNVSTAALDEPVSMTASLWYHSSSWDAISKKADEILYTLKALHVPIAVANGYVWVTPGVPFAQRMNDPDDMVRRIVINVMVEFLTRY